MDRGVLLRHLRRTRFSPEGGEKARSDAQRIAAFLRSRGASRVTGFGSAFSAGKRFTPRSDLDLAVEGLPPERFFAVLTRAQAMTDFELDLVPVETATEYLRRTLREEGVALDDAAGSPRAAKPEKAFTRRPAVEIEHELDRLRELKAELAAAPRDETSFALRARGSMLHDFYGGIERIFRGIAKEWNGGVPQGDRWHRQLLTDMNIEIPGVRPPVITPDLAARLGDFLGFRQVIRDAYGPPDSRRLRPLEESLPETLDAFDGQVRAFLAWIAGSELARPDSPNRASHRDAD